MAHPWRLLTFPGVAALLASMGLDNCAIVTTLLHPQNVDPINWQGGVGRLNAYKAVSNPHECPSIVPSAPANFSGDARHDLLHRVPINAKTWLGNTNPQFQILDSGTTAFVSPRNRFLAADVTGDGESDLVHIDGSGNKLQVRKSNGDGTFTAYPAFSSPYPESVENGSWFAWNLDSDTDADLVHICCDNKIKVWISQGNGTLVVSEVAVGYGAPGALVGQWRIGDFQGSGRGDLFHIWKDGSAKLWLRTQSGAFSVLNVNLGSGYGIDGRWRTGDFNGDGLTDLVHVRDSTMRVWTSNGNGGFISTSVSVPGGYNLLSGDWRTGDL